MSIVLCNCVPHAQPAVQATVTKDTPNKGKLYWKCARPKNQGGCDFFSWVNGGVKRNFQQFKPNFNGGQQQYKKPKFNPIQNLPTADNGDNEFDTFIGQSQEEAQGSEPQQLRQIGIDPPKKEEKQTQTEHFALLLLKERLEKLEAKTEKMERIFNPDIESDITSGFKNSEEILEGQEEIKKMLTELKNMLSK